MAVQFGQRIVSHAAHYLGLDYQPAHFQRCYPYNMLPASLRILLVESDQLFRLGLHMRLQQETGREIVAEAEDGETGVEHLTNRLS